MGRAYRVRKRSNHVTIELASKEMQTLPIEEVNKY
jgi:hypothetical protein